MLNSKTQWLSLMNELKSCHYELVKLLSNKKIAFVDIPFYFNVGDLLIWQGTERLFEENQINIVYRAFQSINHSKLKNSDVILFHGGGNFGDLYTKHQNLRENIIRKYPNKTIVCLPQSIHFDSMENKSKSRDVFSQHNDFHFFVRDTESLEVARTFTNNAKLMPDMAHSLHPLIDSNECTLSFGESTKILNMERVDKEASTLKRRADKGSFDWNQIVSYHDILVRKKLKRKIKINESIFTIFNEDKVVKEWEKLANDIVFKSINHFHYHEAVYTNRLHGYLLSALLGKQIYLNDNSYQKNNRYYNAFMSDYPFMIKKQSYMLQGGL
ncbi:polysaccharide pyruvyl transferase family protein [Vibrio breoganii]